MTYAIQAEGLAKRFKETQALAGVDLAARTGTVLGLLGPNGAGKTTAVRIFATLIRPDAGRALVAGHDVVREPGHVRAAVGLTGQYAAVDENLTGTENLLLIGRLLGIRRKEARARAAELLEHFQLAEAAGRAVKTFSGGMRRRLDLAASLVGRPSILFLDEPTTGLDPRSRGEVWDMLRGLVAEGMTALLTTQYLEEADKLADEIVVIDKGHVIAEGTPDGLKSEVGGQVLQLRPVHAEDLPAVHALVTEAAGDQTHIEGDLVIAPVKEPELMPAVVRRLDGAGIAIGELALRRSSLDEVFLALTGHRAEPEQRPEDEAAQPDEGAFERVGSAGGAS
ncbi:MULTISPECIES: ATP-binding cassette domain-containing protein [unclassified Streptomyces]|uniref:ATP-binding cassette domain-containing protein n=1 Tax=unclassified Streptomyces TaxID=2593676 RepID=UPI0022B6916E|nr:MULTISPECIES: ATP-binding cassette domain-containing protein [unclassified Streptomyces]MCZ7417523.1 ATP-binding cassette domain-containing protein [Streptomyces sp. WMMC897]MCZ7432648.1 ATP-binding cassette domain-containing protein [Streptomyces sp. WMMC1477]